MRDMYIESESLLKSLTRDPITARTRDIKPDEDVMSIWDDIQQAKFRMINPRGRLTPRDGTNIEENPQKPDASYFYGEPDALEDQVLFPEELLVTEESKPLYTGKSSALDDFVRNGPNWHRFINDLDTDEELGYEEDDHNSEEYTDEDESRDESDGGDEDDEERKGKHLFKGGRKGSYDSDKVEDGVEKGMSTNWEVDSNASRSLATMRFSREDKENLALIESWEPSRNFRGEFYWALRPSRKNTCNPYTFCFRSTDAGTKIQKTSRPIS